MRSRKAEVTQAKRPIAKGSGQRVGGQQRHAALAARLRSLACAWPQHRLGEVGADDEAAADAATRTARARSPVPVARSSTGPGGRAGDSGARRRRRQAWWRPPVISEFMRS